MGHFFRAKNDHRRVFCQVRHIRTLNKHIKELCNLDEDEVISSESSLSSTKTQALFLVSTQQRGIPSPRSFQSVIQ